jgi:hypothetical protein
VTGWIGPDNAEVAGSIPASPTVFPHVRGTFEGFATVGDWTCIARSSGVNVRDGGLKKPIGTIVLTGRGPEWRRRLPVGLRRRMDADFFSYGRSAGHTPNRDGS